MDGFEKCQKFFKVVNGRIDMNVLIERLKICTNSGDVFGIIIWYNIIPGLPTQLTDIRFESSGRHGQSYRV